MATSLDGHILKKTSTPIDRLITENYNPDPLNNWDLVNVGFLNLVLALFQNGVDADFAVILAKIAEAFDSMGVKMIRENVALTGLTVFPNIPSYVPKNKERVLLIAQTNPNQNGFYEWQTGGNLVRLFDWRDVTGGSGIAISANNIAIKLLQSANNFLQFDNAGNLFARIANGAVGLKLNAQKELYIDTAELGGGGGGGVSILDVPNPYIYDIAGDNILEPYNAGVIIVNGDCFRTASTLKTTLESLGFTVNSYDTVKPNLIYANVTATDIIGVHDVLAKNLTLNSEDSGKNTFTVLGSAIINSVAGRFKRGTTVFTNVYGEGFALLSVFSANDAGLVFVNNSTIDRFSAQIIVDVNNSVASGFYDLLCTNTYGSASYDSGTSGNGLIEVYGDPLITTVFLSPESVELLAEIHIGEYADIVVNGYDLTDDFVLGSGDGILLSTATGTSTKKTINCYGNVRFDQIGINNLICVDNINSSDSGTSGNSKIALNFPKNTVATIPSEFRALPNFDNNNSIGNWVIVNNAPWLYLNKDGGTGLCWIEVTDIYFAASLLPNFVLGKGGTTKLGFTILTPANSLPTVGGDEGIYLVIADRGITDANTVLSNSDYWIQVQKFSGTVYNYKMPNGYEAQINDLDDVFIDIQTNNLNTFYSLNGTINSTTRTHTSQNPQSVYIGMSGAYEVKFKMEGFLGF